MPANVLPPKKRSVEARDIIQHAAPWDSRTLNIGDKPWYCFFNSTINEFWIFLDQDVAETTSSTNMSSTSSYGTNSSTVTAAATSGTATLSLASTSLSGNTPAMSTAAASTTQAWTQAYPTSFSFPSTWSPSSTYNGQRGGLAASTPEYPLLVKMVEKRKPHSNIQPYCQQMQVLNDWQVMPIPDIPTILVEESEFAPAAATSAASNKMKRAVNQALHKRADTTMELESYCICEWYSSGF